MRALRPEDDVVATYREHGHALLRGHAAERDHGRDVRQARGLLPRPRRLDAPVRRRHRFYGGNAIVGGGLPLAVGLALATGCRAATASPPASSATARSTRASSTRPQPGGAVAAAGAVHLREQPLRDGHGAAARQSQTDLALQRAGYGMVAWAVDGMDVVAVEDAARRAVDARPRRRRPALPGAAHLPLPRPLHVRPGALPRQGGGRAVEAARPDPDAGARLASSGR